MATRAETPTRTTPTRTQPSPAALARAVEPFEVERFLAEHWERQPLVRPARGEEEPLRDLLSTRDVEHLITETGIRLPAFRLVKAGETVAGYAADLSWRPSPFTGVADVHRMLEEFERGATIVLQGLHHLWLPLAATAATWRRSSAIRCRRTRTAPPRARRACRCITTRTR